MSRRSSHKRIAPIDLEAAITEELEKYGAIANSVLEEAIDDVAKKAAVKLQAVHRFAPNGHPTGEYSRDWDSVMERTGRFTSTAIVYNVDNYRLTHLLEFGHVIRNGTKRSFGNAPAYPHIAPVNDWAQEEVIRQIDRRLEDA